MNKFKNSLSILQPKIIDLVYVHNSSLSIIISSIFMSAMFYSALLFQREIKNGYLTRNIIAGAYDEIKNSLLILNKIYAIVIKIKITGVTFFEIGMSFFITQAIYSIVQAFCFFFLVDFFLNISWQSSLLLIIILNTMIGTCGMSIGN